jgi:hypothetical protein
MPSARSVLTTSQGPIPDTDDQAVLEFVGTTQRQRMSERIHLHSAADALTDGKVVPLYPGVFQGELRVRFFSIFNEKWAVMTAPGEPWYDGIPCDINFTLQRRGDEWDILCRSVDGKGCVDGKWQYIVQPRRQDLLSKWVTAVKSKFPKSKESGSNSCPQPCSC